MRQRTVNFSPSARSDLVAVFDYVTSVAGISVAKNYVDRIETFIMNLDIASERGRLRDDIRSGLRVVGFEKRLVVAFKVDENRVTILRVLSRGQNWQEILKDE